MQRAKSDAKELSNLFDMSVPLALDTPAPDAVWNDTKRPNPRKIVLSPYQYEMINYQRMLLRKNIWYYRDRMNVPRGPCPLHVLKDAWVQGVVDENTLMWGHGLYDWLPAKNIKLLLPMIRTPEGERRAAGPAGTGRPMLLRGRKATRGTAAAWLCARPLPLRSRRPNCACSRCSWQLQGASGSEELAMACLVPKESSLSAHRRP